MYYGEFENREYVLSFKKDQSVVVHCNWLVTPEPTKVPGQQKDPGEIRSPNHGM